jgi:hypothetical protein
MMDYGFKVVFANPPLLGKAGFGKVAHLPFIFDGEPGYARLPNQFLIDRGLGYWDPKWRGAKRNPLPPTRQTMKNFAYWLANALEWAEIRGIDLMTADYTSVLINRYQQEMLKGIWSAHKTPLAPETVNLRVQNALEYQMWAADKGLREPFLVPTVTRTYVAGSHNNSKSHEVSSVESRKGKVKVNKCTLTFPSAEQIKEWHERVYDKSITGKTEGLIADLILNTAIRREEASCWRVDTLPLEPKEWKIVNPDQPEEFQSVIVSVKYGAKGKEYAIDEHGDKLGPEGSIHMPLWLAHRINEYRNNDRLLALKSALRQEKTTEAQRRILKQTVHLFINPKTGKRYTGDQIYRFWTEVDGPDHWSPHLGRDWWACTYLWERMKQHAELIQQALKVPSLPNDHPMLLALRDSAQTVIQLEIRPQLRHASAATTGIYLQWLFSQMRVPLNQTRRWADMDEEESTEENRA